MNALKAYTAKRLRNKSIIDQFNERTELALKAEMMVAFHANIGHRKMQRELFYEKVEFVAVKRMKHPIEMWKAFTEIRRLEQKADEFFRKRKAQYILRLTWDSIKLTSLKHRQEQI